MSEAAPQGGQLFHGDEGKPPGGQIIGDGQCGIHRAVVDVVEEDDVPVLHMLGDGGDDAVDIPVILYNVPSRTGVKCSAQTYQKLASHPNIAGVKEASDDFELIQDTFNLCPADFTIWSGNDGSTAAIMALGGKGVISVAANIVPREMHELTQLCLSDRFLEAGQLQLRLHELITALFCEVNPIPVKAAMAQLGLCGGELRLPLCTISDRNLPRLTRAMQDFGVTI